MAFEVGWLADLGERRLKGKILLSDVAQVRMQDVELRPSVGYVQDTFRIRSGYVQLRLWDLSSVRGEGGGIRGW